MTNEEAAAVLDLEVHVHKDKQGVSITGPMGDYWCDLGLEHIRGLLELLDPAALRESRRWYLPDGTYEEYEPDVVIEKRKAAARELETLRRERDEARAECKWLRLKLIGRWTCPICWTDSREPVETEDECVAEEPHEGGHFRCLCCEQTRWLEERNQRIAELEAALLEARESRVCRNCGAEVEVTE